MRINKTLASVLFLITCSEFVNAEDSISEQIMECARSDAVKSNFTVVLSVGDKVAYFGAIGKTKKIGKNFRAWIMSCNEIPDVKNASDETEQALSNWHVKSEKILVEGNCEEEALSFLQSVSYSKSGNVVKSTESYGKKKLDLVVPNTIGDGILNKFCHDSRLKPK